MLWTTSSLTANILISTDSINGIDNGNVRVETPCKGSGRRFLTSGAKLVFCQIKANFQYNSDLNIILAIFELKLVYQAILLVEFPLS